MTVPAPDVFLGLDLGTSGLKAVACSGSGVVLARSQGGYQTSRPERGAAEQDPADWRNAVCTAFAELADAVAPSRWRCVGLSAMVPTLVTTDDHGGPTGSAITWEDARAEPQAVALAARTGDLYAVTGQRLDGRYLLPMLLRLAAENPECIERTSWVLGAKDYLFWWLTGAPATDPSTAAGTGGYELESRRWNPAMRAALEGLLGRTPPRLPRILDPGTRSPIRPELASRLGVQQGLEICLGIADSVAGAVGLGAADAGDVAYLAGTSTVVLAVSERLDLDPRERFLVTPMATEHEWGLEMDLLATGASVRWLASLFGIGEPELVADARKRDVSAAPAFLPFLAPGEQGALWDPHLSGSITGLTLRHDRGDLARGLLTGIVLESRRCLAVLADRTGRAGVVHLGGGGMATAETGQELADATGRQVVVPEVAVDHSALGAALLAARACGVRSAVEPGPTPGLRLLRPNPSAKQTWDLLASRHDALLAALGSRSPVDGAQRVGGWPGSLEAAARPGD
ncbi:MAG: xylulokinase [Nocardioidaceae bacterium]